MNTDQIMSAKLLLRRKLNSVIRNLPEEDILRQSEIVTAKVLASAEFAKAKIISIYLSTANEIQTDTLVYEIFKRGKACFIPRFQFGNPVMEMIRLKSVEQYKHLPRNKWNIRQPPQGEYYESVFERGELDLVLTPGLGFTSAGQRLGRGMGYYDTFFQRCKSQLPKFPYTIGLAFDEQILTEIPSEPHDVILDLIISSKLN